MNYMLAMSTLRQREDWSYTATCCGCTYGTWTGEIDSLVQLELAVRIIKTVIKLLSSVITSSIMTSDQSLVRRPG